MLSAGTREAVDGAGRGGSRAGASLSSDDVHELYVRLQPHAETAPLQRLRQGRPGLQRESFEFGFDAAYWFLNFSS